MQFFVVKKRVHVVFAMWHMVQCMLMNIVQHFKLTNVVQQMLNSLLWPKAWINRKILHVQHAPNFCNYLHYQLFYVHRHVQKNSRNTISLLFNNDLVYLKFSSETPQNTGSLDDCGKRTGIRLHSGLRIIHDWIIS